MKMKGNLIFLISAVFVILVFGSMTITGCARAAKKQRTTHEDGAQPPQPGQPDQQDKKRK